MSKELEKDVLDIFSKVMFFSKWNSPNQSEENKKKREEDIEFIRTELERLAEIDRINELSKDAETLHCLEEVKNGLNGHCKSSYLKDNPEELNKVLDIYNGFFAKIEKSLKALEIIEKYVYVRKPYEQVYEICFKDESESITEEQYELLNEVLPDE